MKTIIYYYPCENLVMICDNGRPTHGFVGKRANSIVEQSLLDENVTIILKTMKSKKIRQLHAIWAKGGLLSEKLSMLEAYNVSSTKDLTEVQLDDMIEFYGREVNAAKANEIRSLRSSVLNLLGKIGITTERGWDSVNAYLNDKRILGKHLYEADATELKALCNKLRNISYKEAKKNVSLN